MKKTTQIKLCGLLLISILLHACVKDKNLEPPPPPDVSFTEEFDTLNSAYLRGWRMVNRSEPIGPSQWQQGSGEFFAYSSVNSNQGYAYVDYYSTSADAGDISNWLVSPVLTMKNGDKISFYTRCLLYEDAVGDSTDYINRLQVRMNTSNQNLPNVNGTATGDFNPLLLDINPDYYPFILSKWKARDANTLKAYPHQWTKYEVTLTGIDKPVKGRFAFRYYLQDGGAQGRGSGVAIDHVVYTSSK